MDSIALAKPSGTHVVHAGAALRLHARTHFQTGVSDVSDPAHAETLEELIAARPARVFETGHHWQMIPAKLFRHEDRLDYLRGTIPSLQEDQVAVLQLPSLGAVALFERHDTLPAETRTGNHVAELFLAASIELSGAYPQHALAFFLENKLWLLLAKAGKTVFMHVHRVISDTDAVFYLAANLQHFGLLRESTTVFVGGQISPLGSLQRQLSIYFEVVDLADALSTDRGPAPVARGEADEALSSIDLLLAYQWALRSLSLTS